MASKPRRAKTTATLTHLSSTSTGRATRLADLIAEIRRGKDRVTEEFYRMGALLGEIVKKKLYLEVGLPSLDALLVAENLIPSSSAFKLMAIASAFTLEQALLLKTEKAYLLARYATLRSESVALVLRSGVLLGRERVPVETVSTRVLGEAVRAARRERSGAATKQDTELRAARTRAKKLIERYRKHGLVVRIQPYRTKSGWMVKVDASLDEFERQAPR